ncbi:MAG: hypothetical protein MJZ81_04730 [Bacteroidales bacterium]|nr:hypothetical protein [Bacteroidales bacterium]
METQKILKLSSISKKIVVALLGGFLLFFLLFHMVANLCILRNDGGEWYRAFCHFMTNPFIKVMEIVLMAALLFHIILTVSLWIYNKTHARPINYKHASKTKTATGSKLMMWTGIVIFLFLGLHFCNFYFAKFDLVPGTYLIETENLSKELNELQNNMTPQMENTMANLQVIASEFRSEEDFDAFLNKSNPSADEMDVINFLKFQKVLDNAQGNVEQGGKYITNLSREDKKVIKNILPKLHVEPDFFYMARDLFKNVLYLVIYLLCFVALWFHMRHAFESAFQTLGLNNYKYNKAIIIASQIYASLICLGFAIVPIAVFFF